MAQLTDVQRLREWGSRRDPDSRLGETIERPETSKHHPYSRASDHPGPPSSSTDPSRSLVAAPVPTPTDPNSSSAR